MKRRTTTKLGLILSVLLLLIFMFTICYAAIHFKLTPDMYRDNMGLVVVTVLFGMLSILTQQVIFDIGDYFRDKKKKSEVIPNE